MSTITDDYTAYLNYPTACAGGKNQLTNLTIMLNLVRPAKPINELVKVKFDDDFLKLSLYEI